MVFSNGDCRGDCRGTVGGLCFASTFDDLGGDGRARRMLRTLGIPRGGVAETVFCATKIVMCRGARCAGPRPSPRVCKRPMFATKCIGRAGRPLPRRLRRPGVSVGFGRGGGRGGVAPGRQAAPALCRARQGGSLRPPSRISPLRQAYQG